MCGLLAAIFSPEFFQHNDLTAWSIKNGDMCLERISFKARGFTFKTQRWTIIWNWKHDGAIVCRIYATFPKCRLLLQWWNYEKVFSRIEKRKFLDGISCLGCTEAFDSIMANRLGIALQNWWFWGDVCVCVCVCVSVCVCFFSTTNLFWWSKVRCDSQFHHQRLFAIDDGCHMAISEHWNLGLTFKPAKLSWKQCSKTKKEAWRYVSQPKVLEMRFTAKSAN